MEGRGEERRGEERRGEERKIVEERSDEKEERAGKGRREIVVATFFL